MPLPTFKSADEIPEAFRSEYEERDGMWTPKDVARLTGAVEKERAAKKEAEARLKELERQVADLTAEKKGKEAGLTDEKLAELRAELAKQLEPVAKERDTLAAQLRTLQLDGAVKSLMAKAGVRGERLDVFWKLVAERFDLTKEGTPVFKTDPTKDLATVLGEEFKAEFPEFYAAPPASGGGANPSATLPKGTDVAKLLATNPLAVLEAANAAGPKKAALL